MNCSRCGKPGVIAKKQNPSARPFKRAVAPSESMLCAECSIVSMIKNSPVLMAGIRRNGVEILLDPRAQAAFARVLMAGNSDLQTREINWRRVVDVWEM